MVMAMTGCDCSAHRLCDRALPDMSVALLATGLQENNVAATARAVRLVLQVGLGSLLYLVVAAMLP